MKKITGTMVARAAGVSQTTVSKVVNRWPKVAPETRAAVIRAARELGYRLAPHGSGRTIALLLPYSETYNILDCYIADLLTAVTREAVRRGLRLEIVMENQLDVLQERFFEGGLNLSWNSALPSQWGECFSCPLVCINAPNSEPNCFSVTLDGVVTMYRLIERFHEFGHRRIGFLTPSTREAEENRGVARFPGFLRALRHFRIPDAERYCLFQFTEENYRQVRETVAGWVADGVSALICADGDAAGRFYRLVTELQLRIPEDISLVGWEHFNISPYLNPPLSGVAIPYPELACAALDLLDACLSGRPHEANLKIPYRFIERQSIGPAPAARSL